MPEYTWPPMDKRKVMGTRVSRLDGPAKSSGKAKYPSDINKDGMLYGAMLTSPHAHAKVKSIDVSPAKSMKGVASVMVVAGPGTELQWQRAEVAYVAAETEQIARDAVRAIKVEYDVLPHLVQEADLAKAGPRAKAAGEQVTGDPDKAFKEADVVSEGNYGIPVITHCCLEPHGSVVSWQGSKIEYVPSSQGVSTVGGDLAKQLERPASEVHVAMDYMGGGFGSKFPADSWHAAAAKMSKEAGGRPVKLFLERGEELGIAGVRPSAYAKIKIAAKKDGSIIGWQSESWASGGFTGGGMPPIPYVYTNIPNRRLNHMAVSLNTGMARAWRAPNHPQASFLTCSAIDDLAAKLNLDPLDVYLKNADLTPRPATYRSQLQKAAELIEWKKNWHPRGEGKGHIRTGLGLGVATWGGLGHASNCKVTIHPDGSVEVELGSQDLGTGTRTAITMVAAETFGLPMSAVKVKMGDNSYPVSGPSGGSTTIGGVSASTRKASVNALDKLFAAIAGGMGVEANVLEAVDSRIQVKGNPNKSMTWKAACQKLGVNSITESGANEPRNAPREGLINQGASGVQMAEVTVDIDTGVVRMKRLVAVQDCGLVVNPKTAESQVAGACIMSICSALMEERITDQQSGKVLNSDMEFYKLAGIGDIGDIIIHMDITPEHDKRGIIGLGEPPAIPGVAAIANAVANAIGVRVPEVPLTPNRVLAALAARRLA